MPIIFVHCALGRFAGKADFDKVNLSKLRGKNPKYRRFCGVIQLMVSWDVFVGRGECRWKGRGKQGVRIYPCLGGLQSSSGWGGSVCETLRGKKKTLH